MFVQIIYTKPDSFHISCLFDIYVYFYTTHSSDKNVSQTGIPACEHTKNGLKL